MSCMIAAMDCMCPLKIHIRNSNSGGILVSGISALIKETQESCLAPSAVRGHD